MAFEKMCVSRRRQFQQENKKNPASSKLIITSFENNNKKRKVPYSIFRLLSLWRGQPLQIGEKILFFFLFPFQFRFDAGFHSQQKKIIIKRQFFLPFSLVSPVCVCVCDETTENPFPACVYYTMPGTLICQQKCRHRKCRWNNLKRKKREELLKRRIFSFIFSLKLLYL